MPSSVRPYRASRFSLRRSPTEWGIASTLLVARLWHDRRAPRDLWDLWALAGINAIDEGAGLLYRKLGPTNRLPAPELFDTPPRQREWIAQLAGQTRLTVDAPEAAAVVTSAWTRVAEGGHDGIGTP